ncbi:MAG: response regulator [bacterium]|nr:response regulator [bacterium]
MAIANKKRIVLFLVFLLAALQCRGQETVSKVDNRKYTGYKYFENYIPEDHKLPPENWVILEDSRGLIYSANQGGILEFDGVTWKITRIPGRTAFSFALAEDGNIYIGGNGVIGYLKPDANGNRNYVSINDLIKKELPKFTSVFQTLTDNQGSGTWFRSSNKLFRWHNGQLTVKETSGAGGSFKAVFKWNGNIYVQEKPIGLTRWNGREFQAIPGSELFSNDKIYMTADYDKNHLLIGTQAKGFFLYDGSSAVPFATELDAQLKRFRLYHGIRLSDGNFALATLSGGLMIMDRNGRLVGLFNKDSGLDDESVRYVFQDSGGNLWLALNRGITRIEYSSPFSLFDKRSDINGQVYSVALYKKRLVVGTASGLYHLPPPAPGQVPRFQPIPGISGTGWSLADIGPELLAATDKGVFPVKMNSANTLETGPEITATKANVLLVSQTFPNHVWAAANNQLIVLKRQENRWITEHRFDQIKQTVIISMAENKKGGLWLGTKSAGAVKLEFHGDLRNPKILRYNKKNRLPGGEVFVTWAAGKPIFATAKGVLRFNETNGDFSPDFLLGKEFADGSRSVFRLSESPNGDIWYHSNSRNFHARFKRGGPYAIDRVPFLRLPPAQVNQILPAEGIVWFASANGLTRYDYTREINYPRQFPALIRSVSVKGSDVIYSGNAAGFGGPTVPPELEYKQRNLHFRASASFFENPKETQFQYFMEGYDDNWSPWSAVSFKSYPNMDYGRFTLRVRAQNVYGTISSEDAFSFRIFPPWYFAWWAFFVYAGAAFLGVYLIVKWRSGKLIREKFRLEQIVEERTLEINQANEELKRKTLLLEDQSKKLQEMDRVKSRFFANISHEFRTPLTLIMGPLDHIRTGLKDGEPAIKKQVGMVHRNARRLLGLINQLLDLSKFEGGKMKLQAEEGNLVDFLKGALEPFEPVMAHHRLELILSVPTPAMPLFFDPEKLEKIMNNLLSNALKFTPPGGRITVSATITDRVGETLNHPIVPGGYVDISVKDTGTGIPPEQLAHIFDRFYQADVTVEHHRKGSGIGLELVKELVELHHGEITVHSSAAGNSGTAFIVRLPTGKEHLNPTEILRPSPQAPGEPGTSPAPTPETVNAIEMMGYEYEDETGDELYMAEHDTLEKLMTEKNIILVVEDNADLRNYIRTSLEPGYMVVEAKNGREGIKNALDIIPDLIISDIMMPEKDGYELCQTLKEDISTSHIPVVLLTAKVSEENILKGLKTGADDYITKPFNPRILRARIRNLIQLRQQLQLKLNREMVLQPSRVGGSEMDREFVKDLQEVIERNLSDPDFNVEDLSKRLYMSRTTVYRKVQALSGESPTDFIRSYRLMRAAQLLKSNYDSVTEVAFEVGFSSRAYFTKCFKQKFHQLPSDFLSSQSS